MELPNVISISSGEQRARETSIWYCHISPVPLHERRATSKKLIISPFNYTPEELLSSTMDAQDSDADAQMREMMGFTGFGMQKPGTDSLIWPLVLNLSRRLSGLPLLTQFLALMVVMGILLL
jgi:hypothetical protein